MFHMSCVPSTWKETLKRETNSFKLWLTETVLEYYWIMSLDWLVQNKETWRRCSKSRAGGKDFAHHLGCTSSALWNTINKDWDHILVEHYIHFIMSALGAVMGMVPSAPIFTSHGTDYRIRPCVGLVHLPTNFLRLSSTACLPSNVTFRDHHPYLFPLNICMLYVYYTTLLTLCHYLFKLYSYLVEYPQCLAPCWHNWEHNTSLLNLIGPSSISFA